MRYSEWGERAARWSGIHSETVDVHGTKVHYLVTGRTRASEVPVHLLVPNPANSASNWLDVLAELGPHAHAIAVDLPGTIAGETALANRRAASIEANALFLRDFTDALGLDRVTVHGWSAGGMIALLFADQAPRRVDGLVLVAPALPPPLSDGEARMWRTPPSTHARSSTGVVHGFPTGSATAAPLSLQSPGPPRLLDSINLV